MTEHPLAFLSHPSLPGKPRTTGLTSILDRGLGPRSVRDLAVTAAEWVDVVKLGWGTARFQSEEVLKETIAAYQDAHIDVCSGGTLLEVAHTQGKIPETLEALERLGLSMVEVSNGVAPLSSQEKQEVIRRAKKIGFRVWSEVGKKDPQEDSRLSFDQRLSCIVDELEAGAEKVILEARESGTIGIYSKSGKPAEELIFRLIEEVGKDRLVFEAPRKSQQVWMVRNVGPDANLGNIAPTDALSLVTLRTGYRGDTLADVHPAGVDVYTELGIHGALVARKRGGVVVMIDALRASATIVTALAIGMEAVRPVASAEECRPAAGREDMDITAGERGGRKLPSVHHGNSPTELMRRDYTDKRLILTTSNGTECLTISAGSRTVVLVGTTLNRTAVAREAMRLAKERDVSVTLLKAGRNNRDTEEDSLAAGAIYRAMNELEGVRLHGDMPMSSGALEAAFVTSDSGRNLRELGYGEDVSFCAQLDRFDVVPVFEDGMIRALT